MGDSGEWLFPSTLDAAGEFAGFASEPTPGDLVRRIVLVAPLSEVL
jgi:hypothetical protein